MVTTGEVDVRIGNAALESSDVVAKSSCAFADCGEASGHGLELSILEGGGLAVVRKAGNRRSCGDGLAEAWEVLVRYCKGFIAKCVKRRAQSALGALPHEEVANRTENEENRSDDHAADSYCGEHYENKEENQWNSTDKCHLASNRSRR